MIFKNASGACPRCKKRRSAHTPAEARQCSAWNKRNLTPAKKGYRKKMSENAGDYFTKLIANQEQPQ